MTTKQKTNAIETGVILPTKSTPPRVKPTASNMALMLDAFCGCIETGILPSPDSPMHHMARWLVDDAGFKFKRKRSKLAHRKPKQCLKIKSPKPRTSRKK